jgi:hypothetical protein
MRIAAAEFAAVSAVPAVRGAPIIRRTRRDKRERELLIMSGLGAG